VSKDYSLEAFAIPLSLRTSIRGESVLTGYWKQRLCNANLPVEPIPKNHIYKMNASPETGLVYRWAYVSGFGIVLTG
jgi:hypothetical protein